jgi:hypothetical protein
MAKPPPDRPTDPMAGVVDRLLAQLPGLQGAYEPSRASSRPIPGLVTVPRTTAGTAATTGRDWIGVWARLGLGLALAIMMGGWPYLRTCGLPLFEYLGAVVTVIVTGMWAAVAAWRHRIGLAHVVALIVVFYGVTLAGAELLPRTGYAADHAVWQCEDGAVSLEPPAVS